MPSPAPQESDHPDGSLQVALESEQFCRWLYRPVVFEQPDRVVHPNSWLSHIPFAFWLIDAMRPATFVELGTHSGNSYAAFAQAIKRLGTSTAAYAVDTWAGDSQAGFYDESVFQEWQDYHDRQFPAFSRLVRSTFEEAAQHFPDGSIDLLHLDGCHVYESVAADFALWRPKMSARGVVLFHDINVRERDFGAWQLWREVAALYPSFAFLHGHGLGVLGVGEHQPEALRRLFAASANARETHAVREFFAHLGSAVSARLAEQDTATRLEATIVATEARLQAALAATEERARTAEAEAEQRAAAVQEREADLSRLANELIAAQREAAAAQHQASAAQREAAAGQHQAAAAQHQAAAAQREAAAARLECEEQLARLETADAERIRLAAALDAKTHAIAELQQHRRQEARGRAQAKTASRPGAPLIAIDHLQRRAGGAIRRGLRDLHRTLRTPILLGFVPTRRRRPRRSSLKLLSQPARLKEARLIVASGLFDEGYYAATNPDVAASGMAPLAHFVLRGGIEGRNPHPLFDSPSYLIRNTDVAAAAANPLAHYLRSGAREGRSPHPLFDVGYYLQANPDVRDGRIDPLAHFLRFGALEGRNPNDLFDCGYYLRHYPDVAASGVNPLVHYVVQGWREGRRPGEGFDPDYYAAQYPDVAESGQNPLTHYLQYGRAEGRRARAEDEGDESEPVAVTDEVEPMPIPLTVRSLAPATPAPPTVICLSHVMPFPPRAGNEYRIFRMLRWLRQCGYRLVVVVAPLPGEQVDADGLARLAEEFTNVVVCERDGRLHYVLGSVPDTLRSLNGAVTGPVSLLLDEAQVQGTHATDLLRMDRAFCHDVLIRAVTRLQEGLGPHVLLAEYIWMTRLLPLVHGDVVKVVDTIDVFSTKRDKVLRFGIDDLHVEPAEEARRLRRADLLIAIQETERQELRKLAPECPVVTAGVDFDVVTDPGTPVGRRVLYVASANPMNVKGLQDFLRFAWPHIRREVRDAELMLAGDVGRAVPIDLPGVRRLGRVADLDPLYRDARVVINPAVAGTGVKIKTLEALGHFRTVVTFPSGVDGIAPELAALCQVVHDWYAFAQRLTELVVADPAPSFTPEERETVRQFTSPEATYRALTDALEVLIRERSGAPERPPAQPAGLHRE